MQFDRKRARKAAEQSAKVRGEWRVWDSMVSCSGATGIPLEHLKLIKATGIRAFRWSKVFEKDLNNWIKRHSALAEDAIPTEANALAYKAQGYQKREIIRLIDAYRDEQGLPHWPWLPSDGLHTPDPTPAN